MITGACGAPPAQGGKDIANVDFNVEHMLL